MPRETKLTIAAAIFAMAFPTLGVAQDLPNPDQLPTGQGTIGHISRLDGANVAQGVQIEQAVSIGWTTHSLGYCISDTSSIVSLVSKDGFVLSVSNPSASAVATAICSTGRSFSVFSPDGNSIINVLIDWR